jgi:hypothetical protein
MRIAYYIRRKATRRQESARHGVRGAAAQRPSRPRVTEEDGGKVLSRHWTSQGVVTYRRRPTGGVEVTVAPTTDPAGRETLIRTPPPVA